MRKLLTILALLFVMVLNIRLLFCIEQHILNQEFGVLDIIIKTANEVYFNHPECDAIKSSVQDVCFRDLLMREAPGIACDASCGKVQSCQRVRKLFSVCSDKFETGKQQSEKRPLSVREQLQEKLEQAILKFRQGSAYNEMGIQQVINLLEQEVTIVSMLQNANAPYMIKHGVQVRTMLLSRSVPSAVKVYDSTMNLATYHPKLKSTCSSDAQCSKSAKPHLNKRDKKEYLRSMSKTLLDVQARFKKMQLNFCMLDIDKACQKIARYSIALGKRRDLHVAV